MPTEQELKDYYNRRHLEMGANAWRPAEAFPIFLKIAGVQPGMTMLDVGCGTGFLLRAAIERGLDATGIDISEEAVSIAGKHNPSADIRVGCASNLPFSSDQFDYVFCLGVLEHFIDMRKGMLEMARVAKPSATFVIVVPNSNYLKWRFQKNKGTEQQDINEQLYTCREWRTFFEESGLTVERIRQDRWWFENRWRYMPHASSWQRTRAALSGFLWLFMPLAYTYQLIFVMRKNTPAADSAP